MSEQISSPAPARALTTRSGSSRQLLTRKALEKAADQPHTDALEASFPGAQVLQVHLQDAQSALESTTGPAPAQPATHPPTWSEENEAAFQALLARRKAAGYQRRGRDVGGQRLWLGSIPPNPGTVVAVIVGIVAEAGALTRAELLDKMAATAFPHAKAQPQDKGWCQGYVAGAIRSGFLAVASEGSPAPTEEA